VTSDAFGIKLFASNQFYFECASLSCYFVCTFFFNTFAPDAVKFTFERNTHSESNVPYCYNTEIEQSLLSLFFYYESSYFFRSIV
jgi:hypothetical protein